MKKDLYSIVSEMDDEEFLAHYGVLGMKWGVRRTPEQLGHKTRKKLKKMDKKAVKVEKAADKNYQAFAKKMAKGRENGFTWLNLQDALISNSKSLKLRSEMINEIKKYAYSINTPIKDLPKDIIEMGDRAFEHAVISKQNYGALKSMWDEIMYRH